MYGVDGPFVGKKLRGVRGDDLPWTIASATGTLDTSGHLTIAVRGLVCTDDPSVPPNLRGINDDDEFRGAVSCITETSEHTTKRRTVTTRGFAATRQGDSDINAQLELPNPCIAPVVFVLGGDENLWFAVNGFESEEEE